MLVKVPKNFTHSVENISSTRKPYLRQGKPIKKSLVELVGRNWATAIVWVAVLSVTVPIFRCGGRMELTAFDWLKEHTIYGSPVQYVPEERYMEELGV